MSRENLNRKNITAEAEAVSRALSSIYTGVFLIDLKEDTYHTVKAPDSIREVLKKAGSAQQAIHTAIQKTVQAEDLIDMLAFVNLATLPDRMGSRPYLYTDYEGVVSGWVRGNFLEVERDTDGNLQKVIYAYQILDEEKRKELEHLHNRKDTYLKAGLSEETRMNLALADNLKYENNFIKLIMNQINCGILAYSIPGRNLLQINREALRVFGWNDFDDASRKLREQKRGGWVLSQEEAQRLLKLREQEGSVIYRFATAGEQGEERQILAESKSLAGRHGGMVILSTFMDVTHMMHLEADNLELTQAVEAVHASLNAGSYIATYDEDGQELLSIRFSDTLRRLYGYEPDDPEVPDNWQTWMNGAIPEDRAYVESRFNAAVRDRTGNTPYDVEYRCQRKDGEIRWMRAAGYVLRREDGSPIACYGLVMDINDQKKASVRIEEAMNEAKLANEAKTSFLARMSHDIRTPLNGILGLIELNDKHADDFALTAANRQKARVAANHLLSLVNDVLQISKMEDPNVELSHEPFEIMKLVNDVFTIIEMRAAPMGITVRREDDDSVHCYPYVWGSPLHVRQILINLLGNAVKYNRKNGSIRAGAWVERISEEQVRCHVDIKDTGIGMSEEFLGHLFDPFAREHEGAGKYEGTGLGLAIVKQLVDKMGGTIQVESRVGEGSRFTLELPFTIAGKDDIEETDEEMTSADISGRHILLVEDNELNMEIAEMLLTDAGAHITRAVNGRQAVERFAAAPPGTYDVILMDVMMPLMNGYEATEAIRAMAREDAKQIPILAITANAFTEDVERAKRAGMNDHLSKPLNVQKMISLIARYTKE